MYRGHCIQYLENLSECLSLKEGDFFLLGPGVTHGLLQQEENAVLIKTIIPLGYLGSEFVQRLQGQQAMFWADALSSRPEQAHCLSYCDSTEDERLFMERMMTTYYSKKEFRDDCCRCWLQLLLISLEHRQGICRKYRLSYGGMEIGRMIQYIYEHSENVTLEQLADFFSYSPSYLSRAIKEGCGMTFLNLLRECRLEKAAMLLSSSRLTIEEIAAQVGYKNTTSVYEGIKLKFGISPGEYRSKYGQSNGPQTANK